jgi:hypothetical protein
MNDELKITKKPFSTINNFFRTVRKERVSHNNVNYRKKQKKTKSR